MDLKQEIKIAKTLQLIEISKPYKVEYLNNKVSIVIDDYNYSHVSKITNFLFTEEEDESKPFNVDGEVIETNYDPYIYEMVKIFSLDKCPLQTDIYRDREGNITSIDFYTGIKEDLVSFMGLDFLSKRYNFRYNMQKDCIKIYFK